MRARRSSSASVLVSLVSCLVLCSMVFAETPELLSLTDNTSNDFSVSKYHSPEGVRLLSTPVLSVMKLSLGGVWHDSSELLAAEDNSSPTYSELFILHSVLRR